MDNHNLTQILEIVILDLVELKTEVMKLESVAEAGIEVDRIAMMRIGHRKFVLETILKHIEVYIKMGDVDWDKEIEKLK